MMFESLIPFTELKKYVVLMTEWEVIDQRDISFKKAEPYQPLQVEETCIVYGMPRAAVERYFIIESYPATTKN